MNIHIYYFGIFFYVKIAIIMLLAVTRNSMLSDAASPMSYIWIVQIFEQQSIINEKSYRYADKKGKEKKF